VGLTSPSPSSKRRGENKTYLLKEEGRKLTSLLKEDGS
jgi:hypothetical protein